MTWQSAHRRIARRITLAVFAVAIAVVVGCDAGNTAANEVDTVQTVDTIHGVDTLRTTDTIRTVDTVHTVDTVQRVSYYLVAFHEDSASKSCSPAPCTVIAPTSADFTGSITERSDSMFLAVGNSAYNPVPMTSVHLDSLATTFRFGTCGGFTLYMTATTKTLRGRWDNSSVCDGTVASKGTFIATLQ